MKLEEGIKKLEKKLNKKLNKKLKNLYVTEDSETGIIACISHKYIQGKKEYYWFAYKDYYYENLRKNLNQSKKGHWHIQIFVKENEFKLRLKGKNNVKEVTEYKV